MRYIRLPDFLPPLLTLASAAVIPQTRDILPLDPRNAFPASSNILKPINVDAFKSATGLPVRDVDDFSRLDLSTQAEMIYGTPGNNGQMLLANMTLYAPDGKQIVMMERFEGLTSAVDCEGDDGSMSLTFKSKEAFDYALSKWTWINDDDTADFLMIANHDGCGPDDQRQAYTITKVDNDEATFITHLSATPAAWSDISGNFDMEIGRASLTTGAAQRLRGRGLFDDIKEGIENGVDAVTDIVSGDASLDKQIVIDMSAGEAGKRTNLFTDPLRTIPRLVVDCADCYITGNFRVSGQLSVSDFKLQSLTFDAAPENFLLKVLLDIKVADQIYSGPGASTGNLAPPDLSFKHELADFAIPGAGISIPQIFELGAILSYEVGVTSGINGAVSFTLGVEASLPNNATLLLDVTNPDASSADGFDGAELNPEFEINSANATLAVTASSTPKLTFGIEVVGVGKLEAALKLNLPSITGTVAAEYNQDGVCEKTAEASKTGVRFGANAMVALVFAVDKSVGSTATSDTLLEKTIWSVKKPFLDQCYPIDIPGLIPEVNGTSNAVNAKSR